MASRFPALPPSLFVVLLLCAGAAETAPQSDPLADPKFAPAAERAQREGDKVFRWILINGSQPKQAQPPDVTSRWPHPAAAPPQRQKRAKADGPKPGGTAAKPPPERPPAASARTPLVRTAASGSVRPGHCLIGCVRAGHRRIGCARAH
jgi:hypothetical protein